MTDLRQVLLLMINLKDIISKIYDFTQLYKLRNTSEVIFMSNEFSVESIYAIGTGFKKQIGRAHV